MLEWYLLFGNKGIKLSNNAATFSGIFVDLYSLLSTSILSFISSANLPADRVLWEIISTLSSCCACANGYFEFKFDAIGETTSTTPLCWLLLLLLLLFLILSMNIVGMFGLILLLERLYDILVRIKLPKKSVSERRAKYLFHWFSRLLSPIFARGCEF